MIDRSARTRGELVATVLRGAWRAAPPPLPLGASELEEVTPLLLRSGGTGLGWWRARHSEWKTSAAAAELKQGYRLHTLQAAVHERQIAEVVATMGSLNVRPLLAKGWTAARLYPEAGLRPYGDIDLYVRPEQYRAARAELLKEGAPLAPVDLHCGIAELDDRVADEWYERSSECDLEGQRFRILGAEDHLRLLCLHALRHGLVRPIALCDIGAALESRPLDFDWDYFLRGDGRRKDYVLGTLRLAAKVLGARVGGTPLERSASTLPAWLAPTLLRQWGVVFKPREPMTVRVHNPARLLAQARHHWPNPIEATVGVGGPFNELPRLPFQIAHTLARTARFVARAIRV